MARHGEPLAVPGVLCPHREGGEKCPNRDDAPAIEQKMREADGVIFASPVYGMNVSGLFKLFVDRSCYIFHRPRFFDKKALLLTTAGALGVKEVLSYLALVAQVRASRSRAGAGCSSRRGRSPSTGKRRTNGNSRRRPTRSTAPSRRAAGGARG